MFRAVVGLQGLPIYLYIKLTVLDLVLQHFVLKHVQISRIFDYIAVITLNYAANTVDLITVISDYPHYVKFGYFTVFYVLKGLCGTSDAY